MIARKFALLNGLVNKLSFIHFSFLSLMSDTKHTDEFGNPVKGSGSDKKAPDVVKSTPGPAIVGASVKTPATSAVPKSGPEEEEEEDEESEEGDEEETELPEGSGSESELPELEDVKDENEVKRESRALKRTRPGFEEGLGEANEMINNPSYTQGDMDNAFQQGRAIETQIGREAAAEAENRSSENTDSGGKSGLLMNRKRFRLLGP